MTSKQRIVLILVSFGFLSLVMWAAFRIERQGRSERRQVQSDREQAARKKPRFEEEIKGLSEGLVVLKLVREAHSFELISILPENKEPGPDRFHHYGVLGRAILRDPAKVKELADAFREGVLNPGPAAMCFDPRHCIHIAHAGRVLDLVICFHCGRSRVLP